MSLLAQRKGAASIPRLEGKELLAGPNPEICKVKGVMFAGRKTFLTETFGAEAFQELLEMLSPRTRGYARTPLASSWYEFESIVELDAAIHEKFGKTRPDILALIGAASAELGIGRIYRSLDSAELVKFMESTALFNDQYQKFGKVTFEQSARGGRMVHSEYPCYSPVYCASAVGYYLESILRHGGVDPTVVETECQCRGDRTCTYEMTWK